MPCRYEWGTSADLFGQTGRSFDQRGGSPRFSQRHSLMGSASSSSTWQRAVVLSVKRVPPAKTRCNTSDEISFRVFPLPLPTHRTLSAVGPVKCALHDVNVAMHAFACRPSGQVRFSHRPRVRTLSVRKASLRDHGQADRLLARVRKRMVGALLARTEFAGPKRSLLCVES